MPPSARLEIGRAVRGAVRNGVIPQQDDDVLIASGLEAIFGRGTNSPEATCKILRLIGEARGKVAAE